MKVSFYPLIGALCLWTLPLGAAIIPAASNIGQPFNTQVLAGNNNVALQVAVSFTTGPLPTDFSGVTLYGSSLNGPALLRVALYTGMGPAGPTGILATLTGTVSPGLPGAHVYLTPAPVVLTGNTTYWLVASAPSAVNPSGFLWRTTASFREDAGSLSGWSLADSFWVTDNGGASWVRDDNRVPQFSVDVNQRPDTLPVITVQPTPLSPFVGNTVTLSAAATGNPPPTIQWRKDGVAVAGATGNSLTLVTGSAGNAGSYSVVAANSSGSVTSEEFVVGRPVFALPPASQRVPQGATVTFTGSASSNVPVTYQWLKDGTPITSGATLTISDVQLSNTGSYSVVATNIAGSTTSAVATLTLDTSNAARLTNLSIRSNAGTGNQALIVGVVIGGATTTGATRVLMRGVGPSLAGFGVTGFLADPTLSLLSGATVLASNDNWGGDAQVAAIGSQVGAFPLAASASRDAALYRPALNSGAYTIQIAGVGGTTGIALAEIYDATPADVFFPTTPRLINVSARTQVGTDANVVIAGFTISGGTFRTLLIRAVGPTLTGLGVSGALADPTLEFSSANIVAASNDNWGGDAVIAAAATSVGAFPLPAASRDAALLVTIGRGSYSVRVSGVGNTTGVALLEIYEVEEVR